MHPSKVSRVLNEDATLVLRDETRNRILELAERRGYRANRLARGLKTASTGAVAIIVPSLRNPVWAQIVHGVTERAKARDYLVVLLEVPDEAEDSTTLRSLVDAGRVDGLLIASVLGSVDQLDVPHVFVDRGGHGHDVVTDEKGAIARVLEHLAGLGHRAITLLDGPANVDTVARRRSALVSQCDAMGLSWSIHNAEFDERASHGAVRGMLGAPNQPSALILSSFNQVVGGLGAIREAGVLIPAELSVVSLDDDRLLEFSEVPVTAVRMPLFELGQAAFDKLADEIEGRPSGDVLISEPMSLIVRRSTGPAPSRAGKAR